MTSIIPKRDSMFKVTLKCGRRINIPKNEIGSPKATQNATRGLRKKERRSRTKIIPRMAFSKRSAIRSSITTEKSEVISRARLSCLALNASRYFLDASALPIRSSEFVFVMAIAMAVLPLNFIRSGDSLNVSMAFATSLSRTLPPEALYLTTISPNLSAYFTSFSARSVYSSLLVLTLPPVTKTLALEIEFEIWSKVTSKLRNRGSVTEICISSSGKPERDTCEIPSILKRSSSISWAVCLRMPNGTLSPTRTKDIPGRVGFTFSTTGGSEPMGKEGILSTAFLTSSKTRLMSKSVNTSILTVPEFSLEMEVMRSIPSRPFRFLSIFSTTPSSTSLGEAPGKETCTLIRVGSESGNMDELSCWNPK